MERDSAIRALSLVYEEIYLVDAPSDLVICRTSASLLRGTCTAGMRISYAEARRIWLDESVDPRDFDDMVTFLDAQSARVGAQRYDILRHVFRIARPEGDDVWCEGCFIPVGKDDFMFCCRRLDPRGSSRAQERHALSELKRLLWETVAARAGFTALYDFETRRRIDPDTGSPFTRGVDTSLLDNLKGHFARCVHPADLPSDIMDGTVFGELAELDPMQQKITYGLRMRFENEAYRWYSLTLVVLDARAGTGPILGIALCLLIASEPPQLMPIGGGPVMEQSEIIAYCWGQRDNPDRGKKPGYLLIMRVDGYSALTFDEKDEAGHIIENVLCDLRAVYGYEAARMNDGSYIVCYHGAEEQHDAEEMARDIQKNAHEALAVLGGITVSVALAPCLHDRVRGFKVAYDEANRLLESPVCSDGSLVVYPDELQGGTAGDDAFSHHHSVYIRTFGFFEVFVDGRPVLFRNEKAKELLALLVDRRGGFVGSHDAVSCLWEDEPVNKVTLARHRKAAMFMHRTLEEYGIGDIVVNENGRRRIDPTRVRCDLFEYLAGSGEPHGQFKGIYMLNYSWSEITIAELLSSRLGY